MHNALGKLRVYPSSAFTRKRWTVSGSSVWGQKCRVDSVSRYISAVAAAVSDWTKIRKLIVAVFDEATGRLTRTLDFELGGTGVKQDAETLQTMLDAMHKTPLLTEEHEMVDWRLLLETDEHRLPINTAVEMLAEIKTRNKLEDMYATSLVTPIASIAGNNGHVALAANLVDF